jgi:hypothetical protein
MDLGPDTGRFPLSPTGRSEVCDGAHRIFVMKNVEVRLRRLVKNPKQWADVESHPSRNEGRGNREIV